jgi:hypothetical protein
MKDTYPMVAEIPFKLNESWMQDFLLAYCIYDSLSSLTFKLIGNPCNGPMGLPFFSRYSSRNFALS